MEIGELARLLAPIRSLEVGRSRASGNDVADRRRIEPARGDRGGAASSGVVLSLSERASAIAAYRDGDAPGPNAGRASEPSEFATVSKPSAGDELSREEEQEVRELRARDAEVRAHENAHKAAAGRHSRGGPSYEYERGPDGRQYAVGGEVSIDSSPVAGDPDATIQKMQQVRRAALAPANPSPQDRKVASEAARSEQAARAEKLEASREERSEGGSRTRVDAYSAPAEDARGVHLDLIA